MEIPGKIVVMIMVDDVARADLLLSSSRTYYRFATDSSIEDGELKGIERFESIAGDILDVVSGEVESGDVSHDVRLQLYFDNRLMPFKATEESLGRLIDILSALFPEFGFLRGFQSR